jgi:hypothetical protein
MKNCKGMMGKRRGKEKEKEGAESNRGNSQ